MSREVSDRPGRSRRGSLWHSLRFRASDISAKGCGRFRGHPIRGRKSKRPMIIQSVCMMTCWCRSLPIKGSHWVAERACVMAEHTRFTAERSRSALRLRDRILHGNYRTCCRKQWSCHRDRARAIARVPGRKNLRHLSHVEVIAGDATTYDAGKVNAIYMNAGATHPMPLWLDSLMLGGRLIFPLVRYQRGGESWIVNARAGNRDFETGLGLMLRIQRTATGYATGVVSPAVFFSMFWRD